MNLECKTCIYARVITNVGIVRNQWKAISREIRDAFRSGRPPAAQPWPTNSVYYCHLSRTVPSAECSTSL
ncbi:hypothetical protein J6590_094626, partial [Homalodisca vitripennis]